MIPMKMTVLIVAIYYLGGAAAAAWMLAKGHFDARLALLVLPLLYLAHLYCAIISGWGRKHQSLPKSPKHICPTCENDVGMFRRLARRHCCSPEQEQLHLAKLGELAIERLRSSSGGTPSLNPSPTKAVREENQSNVANGTLVLPHRMTRP
jgi:hypothetical protein